MPDLRTSHGGAPPLTRAPVRAARTASALLCATVLALTGAGCGGSETRYQEVPGPPASVPIPQDTGALDSGSDSAADDADADATATPDAGTTAPSDQSGATDTGTGTDTAAGTGGVTDPAATGGADPSADAGGGATAPAEPDSPAADTPPPAGSEAEQFEDFCAQNAGAC